MPPPVPAVGALEAALSVCFRALASPLQTSCDAEEGRGTGSLAACGEVGSVRDLCEDFEYRGGRGAAPRGVFADVR